MLLLSSKRYRVSLINILKTLLSFSQVIEACALKPDLEILTGGDQVLIISTYILYVEWFLEIIILQLINIYNNVL